MIHDSKYMFQDRCIDYKSWRCIYIEKTCESLHPYSGWL